MIIVTLDFHTNLDGTTMQDFRRELELLLRESYSCRVEIIGSIQQKGFDFVPSETN